MAPPTNPCVSLLQVAPSTSEEFGRIIGINPLFPMDQDFRDIFGSYLATHNAREASLDLLANEIFQKRYALAQKYKTRFASTVESVGVNGEVISLWKTRLEGISDSPVWSFGFKDHERADEIWRTLNDRLDPNSAQHIMVNEPFGKGLASVWSFNYFRLEDNRWLRFKIYGFEEANGMAYFIPHPASKVVPTLLRRLRKLWGEVLTRDSALSFRVTKLAEFEWLWFWTNPYGRAGATIGRTLSLLAQKAMVADGLSVNMPREFYPEDLAALSKSLAEYTTWRLQVLKGSAL